MSKQIFLTGIVDDYMAEDFRHNLMSSSEKSIDIYISCMGGDVNKGFEIANLIQGIQKAGKKDVHTFNLAHADSIATVIFLAADQDKRHAVESSTLFMHEPRFMSMNDITMESSTKAVKELEMQTKRIADYYVKNISGLALDEAFELMKNETNLDAGQMVNFNIVSEIVPNFEIAAKRGLIINQKQDKMRFGLKKDDVSNVKLATFALKLADDSILIHEGELIVGTEVTMSGETEPLNGEYVDVDGRTIVVENGVVTEIKEMAAEPDATTNDDPTIENVTVENVTDLLADFETRIENMIDSKITALRKEGSTASIKKVDNVKSNALQVGTQTSARKNMRKQMQAIAAKKKELQNK